jgi:signal transduction histidine kinase
MQRSAHNITAKAFIGFLILAIVFGAGTYLIYDRLHDLDPAVQRIREPNKLLHLWRETSKNSNAAVTSMRRYLLTGDTALISEFDAIRLRMDTDIDSMRTFAADDPVRLARVDSFHLLLDRKLEESTLGIALMQSNQQMTIAIDNALQMLAVAERKREQVKQHAAQPEILTGKEPNDSVAASKSLPVAEKNTFWRRILSKRKKGKDDTAMSIEALASMLDSIIADSNVTVANNVVPPPYIQDTINRAMQIADQLTRAKTEDFEAREAQLQSELQLLAQRKTTDSMMTELGTRMSQAENKAIADLISDASAEVRSATYNIITILSVGAILLILLFTVLIRADVKRNARLQEKMEEARIAAEELAKIREEFAANMSHEIRGPLNSIMGISEQLNKNPGAGNKKLVEGLLSSSQHLLGLINPVLDVTRLNSGMIEFEVHPIDVRETLNDVQRAFRVSAAEKVIGLEVKVAQNVPKAVLGDDVRLRQILFNLVGNAIKFTDKGSVTISCESQGPEKDGVNRLLFKVTDTGIGIEPTAINRIFDEYAQADSTITRKFGGTGLGLSISRKLVEQQNGKISVESEVGKGSEFSFEIPFEVAEEITEQQGEKAVHQQILKGKEILICDDDEMNRMLAAMIITSHGGKVTECGDGESVIRAISTGKYDLIVLDINLPGMDGKATVAELRLLGKRIPVIAVTGNAHEEENFAQAGFDAIIIKPYQESQLLDVISKFVVVPVQAVPLK